MGTDESKKENVREKVKGWPGYVRGGVFIIEKKIGGKKFHRSTHATTLRGALKQLERFEADPQAFTARGTVTLGALALTETLIDVGRLATERDPLGLRPGENRGIPRGDQTAKERGRGGKNRNLLLDERNVHRPVGATLAVLARPVERVDDPDPRCGEAGMILLLVLGGLLAQHGVLRTLGCEPVDQVLMGGEVPTSLDHVGGGAVGDETVAESEQQRAGPLRELRGETMVVGGGHHDTVVVTRRCHRRAVPVTSSSPSGRRSGVRCQLAAAWRCRALITGVVSTAPCGPPAWS